MKSVTFFSLFLLFNLVSISSQTVLTEKTLPDTLVILRSTDDMSDRVLIYPSMKIVCANETRNKGFVLGPFIDSNLTIKDISVKMVDLGSCAENNELIILFEDGSKITKRSWDKFDCNGTTYFRFTSKELEPLLKFKITKIRFTNGHTFDSFTSELDKEQSTYFIRLFNMLNTGKIFDFKSE